MSAQTVRLRFRPLRFGWCVRQGNLEEVRRVLQITHTLWGGRYNPIIPVGCSLDAQLVDLYQVDALYPASDDLTVAEFIAQFRHLRWPSVHKNFFINSSSGEKLATFLEIYHPARMIFEEYVKDKPKPVLIPTTFSWDPADPLADMMLALFGAYPSKAISAETTTHSWRETSRQPGASWRLLIRFHRMPTRR
jgi:hypothetical protein